ncbi:MAG: hypothetical protein ACI906_003449 [Candidatus Latescibacterota bacterium]|jgi:hypothetical protein
MKQHPHRLTRSPKIFYNLYMLHPASIPFAKRSPVHHTLCSSIILLTFIFVPIYADEIRFSTPRDWQAWSLPGTVALSPTGAISPVAARRDINAVANAATFGGGIRSAGSNAQQADRVMDGDLDTGWSPDPLDAVEDWTLEVDLGRGVSARRIRLVFDAQGPAPELFALLLSTGEHAVDEVGNPIPGTVVYRLRERFKENKRHVVIYELDQSFHTPIQYVRLDFFTIEPGTRLLEVEVEALGDNMALGVLERGGNLEVVLDAFVTQELIPLGNAQVLIDGDLFTNWRIGRTIQAERDVFSQIVLDLGATYFIDKIKIVGGVVARPGGGITAGSGQSIDFFVTRRSFGFDFYEVLSSDGSLAPDGSLIWQKHYSGTASQHVKNTLGAATHEFGLTPTRFIKILWRSWEAGGRRAFRGSAEEFQVFGQGFPQNLIFNSHIIDLEEAQNLDAVAWRAQVPPSARLEVRSRSGNEVESQLSYYDKNGKEVTQKRYGKLIPSFRGPIDTVQVIGSDWSSWSKIYAFSGQEFQSPSPRRYTQLQVRMVTEDPSVAPELDELKIEFSEPISERAISEIFPTQVAPGQESEFSLFLRPLATKASGFNRLIVESPTKIRFTEAQLNGAPAEINSEEVDAGFHVTFAQPLRDNDLIELRFAALIYQQSTPFTLFIQDTRLAGDSRQRIDPGDATDLVESSSNIVGLPIVRDLLINAEFNTAVLTPNGDGVNDELKVAVDVVNVLEARPLSLRLCDLAGRQLAEISQDAQAGAQQLLWDGRTEHGKLVPPGLYLLELYIAGDAGDEFVRRVISVVY